ncbi:basic proline-rich protein-like [Moschus berezovskii]|uniref:basic proline-rich protein-like n=1 Tax=Moschus berezovskii TaxID=68408 RepID=UPI0024437D19|nr:basic proline-rich protein-like [Moschus berezovskii]
MAAPELLILGPCARSWSAGLETRGLILWLRSHFACTFKITLGFWFDPVHGQVKDSWQRRREVWKLSHAFCHPKRNQRRENPSGLYGLPGTVVPGPLEEEEEVGLGEPGAPGSPSRGSGCRRPHARSPRLPRAEAAADPRAPGRRHPAAWGQPVSLRPPLPRPGLDPGPRTLRAGWRPARGPAGPQCRGLNGEQVPAPPGFALGVGKAPRDCPRASHLPFSLLRTGPLEPGGGPAAPAPIPREHRARAPPAPASETQEHCINTLGPDLDTEDFCFKKIQSSLKSCNLYAF